MSWSINRVWYKRGWLSGLLLPLAWLFAGVTALRRRRQIKQSRHQQLPVPVIVVGNISVGGTGKTPLLIKLVRVFRNAGYTPGVVSRGYGGNADNYPLLVNPDTSPDSAGDEPVLIAQQCQCPVVVDPDRLRAARYLCEYSNCDLILSDDGLQHYRLPRNIEIAVVDGQRLFGNGRLLPAGPLREPVKRLWQADYVVVNGGDPLAGHPSSYSISLEPQTVLRHVTTGEVIAVRDWKFSDRAIHAVAGIGNPQRFADTLSNFGFDVELHPFPDHHRFSAQDFCFEDTRPVFMTAKDAVKCRGIGEIDGWVLDVEAQVPASMLDSLVQKVKFVSEKS